ncbi:MAG: 5-bromo-4-chloroindolyl phosphate hydrolysis family protein [Christensenellales bacterium]|jgi:hypothetical protein
MTEARRKKRVPIPLKTEGGPPWIAIIVTAMFGLFPVTAILGFLKIRALWKNKRLDSYRTYMGVVGNRAHISLNRIAKTVGQPRDTVLRVLGEMIANGYLGPDAYIDYSVGYLILEQGAGAPEEEEARGRGAYKPQDLHIDLSGLRNVVDEFARGIKKEVKINFTSAEADAPKGEARAQKEPEPQEAKGEKESDHEAILRKLKALNDQILDEDVSQKIDRIAELTDDIYEFIAQNPDRAGQVRTFMNYYLPTTVKLLTSYGMLERQSYQGENIVAARKNIEDILATLVYAFEKQLDKLFAAEAIDISSDIQVLETMIAKDGLTRQAMQLKL